MTSKPEDFTKLAELGAGSFGCVFKVKRKEDKGVYVMKKIETASLGDRERKAAINEVRLMGRFDTPYVVHYYDSFFDEKRENLHIIMEYCGGGDLEQHIKASEGPLPEDDIWRHFIHTSMGLCEIHKQRVLHRDIKCMNIFLTGDKKHSKLGDLGVAKKLGENTSFAKTLVGTPYYLSPELVNNKPYNEKSDVWALGCVLYQLCTKKHPFEAFNQAALMVMIIKAKFEPVTGYSDEVTRIVNLLIQRNPEARPTVLELLCDPFIQTKAKELAIPMPSIVTRALLKINTQKNARQTKTDIKSPERTSLVIGRRQYPDAKRPVSSMGARQRPGTSVGARQRPATSMGARPRGRARGRGPRSPGSESGGGAIRERRRPKTSAGTRQSRRRARRPASPIGSPQNTFVDSGGMNASAQIEEHERRTKAKRKHHLKILKKRAERKARKMVLKSPYTQHIRARMARRAAKKKARAKRDKAKAGAANGAVSAAEASASEAVSGIDVPSSAAEDSAPARSRSKSRKRRSPSRRGVRGAKTRKSRKAKAGTKGSTPKSSSKQTKAKGVKVQAKGDAKKVASKAKETVKVEAKEVQKKGGNGGVQAEAKSRSEAKKEASDAPTDADMTVGDTSGADYSLDSGIDAAMSSAAASPNAADADQFQIRDVPPTPNKSGNGVTADTVKKSQSMGDDDFEVHDADQEDVNMTEVNDFKVVSEDEG